MTRARRARIFHDGSNQAVRIPGEFEFEREEVTIEACEDGLLLRPTSPTGPLEFRDQLAPLDVEFPEIEDAPAEPVDPRRTTCRYQRALEHRQGRERFSRSAWSSGRPEQDLYQRDRCMRARVRRSDVRQ